MEYRIWKREYIKEEIKTKKAESKMNLMKAWHLKNMIHQQTRFQFGSDEGDMKVGGNCTRGYLRVCEATKIATDTGHTFGNEEGQNVCHKS